MKRLITYGTSIASCTTRFKNGVLFVDIESLDPENDLQSFDPSLTISRLSMRLLALVQDVKEIRWSYEGDDLGIFKKSDFDSIKEAYLHPIILQNWMEKASSTSSATIILNYKDLRDAQFTEFIIWHEGKKVYMNGMPNAPLSSLQTNLNEGEYEAEVKVKLDGNTLKSGLIRFKYSNKWQPIEFVIEKEKRRSECGGDPIMKNLIKLGFIGLLMFTMVGCHSQKKEDPSIYPVMKEAFEYQQETGAEGCYQTVAIHDGHALTFYNDIWKSEGIQYDLNDCLRTDPVEIRVQSVTAIDGEQGIVMNLKKEEEQYIDDGYTSMPIVFVINNPFSSTLSTIFQRDVKGEIIGLDPNYSYEREGQVIKVTLKDPNEKVNKFSSLMIKD